MTDGRFPKPIDVDLLLVFPPFERRVVSMENIGIEYIAASARAAGHRCALVNAGLYGLSTGDVVEIVRRSRFRVLGISTIHWTMPAALEIAGAAKRHHPGGHIVFGGLEAALDAERILREHPFVDSVGLGEGERTTAALLEALSGGEDWREIAGLAWRDGPSVRRSRTPRLIDPLDDLPFPARDDITAVLDAGGPVSMSSSRGCPGRCSFCSVRAFYGLSEGPPWRGRSPRSVVAEMREIAERTGARLFSFIDETVVGPGERGSARLAEFAALIGGSGLKAEFFMTVRADQVEEKLFRELRAAGLRKVEIGIESMAATQLGRFGKSTRVEDNRRALAILEGLGIAAELFLVPFDPGVTPDELETNLRFYRERFEAGRGYDVTPLSLSNYLYPYPGTGTRAVYEKNGWLDGNGPAAFRAADGRMQKVGDALVRFVGASESAFPMSFLGLGNLWVNSAGLPAPVFCRIGGMCADIGNLFVDFAEWALDVTARPQPIPIGEIGGLVADLRRFLARLEPLRGELRAIAAAHGNGGGTRRGSGSAFAGELFFLGRHRKRRSFQEAAGAPDEYGTITGILDALTREVPS
jgi:anaerobic magnesium-protoporphyrin IX monomethyl ester cyclase